MGLSLYLVSCKGTENYNHTMKQRNNVSISSKTYELLGNEKTRTGVPITSLIDQAVRFLVYGDTIGRKQTNAPEIPLSLYTEIKWIIDLSGKEQDNCGELLKNLIKRQATEWSKEPQ